MAKKQAQFRFEEDFYSELLKLASKEGVTVSEVVRNALRLYSALYERTKDRRVKIFIEPEDIQEPKCEVILPWIH